MSFSFHPEAEAEFNEAIDNYEGKRSELGYDFAMEVYLAIDRILAFPKAWLVMEGEIRRYYKLLIGFIFFETKIKWQ